VSEHAASLREQIDYTTPVSRARRTRDPDAEYDALVRELIALESEFPS